jgi:hypothetical protein
MWTDAAACMPAHDARRLPGAGDGFLDKKSQSNTSWPAGFAA